MVNVFRVCIFIYLLCSGFAFGAGAVQNQSTGFGFGSNPAAAPSTGFGRERAAVLHCILITVSHRLNRCIKSSVPPESIQTLN